MKKILVLSTLAMALTTGSVTDAVAQENKTNQTTENKENNESKFKDVLSNPSEFFDFKVSKAKYAVKNTDTEYLLLAATSEDAKEIYQVKVFALDKSKDKVVEIEEEFILGNSDGAFSGNLEEYKEDSNKLRYTVKSETSKKFEIKDITFAKNDVEEKIIKEGELDKEKFSSDDVKGIEWKTLEVKNVNSSQLTSAVSSVTNTSNRATSVAAASTNQSTVVVKQAEETTKKVERVEKKKSKFDINAIANGDLSSLYGTYGNTIINSASTIGLVENDNKLSVNTITKKGDVAIISSSFKQVPATTTVSQTANTETASATTAAAPAPVATTEARPVMVDQMTVNHYVVPAGVASPVKGLGDDVNRDRVIVQGHQTDVHYVDNK